jgi:hypothetical protein
MIKDGWDEGPGGVSDPLRKWGVPYPLLHLLLFLQALPAAAQSVIALLRGALELALPTHQWHAGDIPLVGGVKTGLLSMSSFASDFPLYCSLNLDNTWLTASWATAELTISAAVRIDQQATPVESAVPVWERKQNIQYLYIWVRLSLVISLKSTMINLVMLSANEMKPGVVEHLN